MLSKMQLRKMTNISILIALLPVLAADGSVTSHEVTRFLAQYIGSEVPGLQYTVVDAKEILFEFAGGFADIQNQKTMTLDTTLMAYSMTKTYTAIAILQLAEQGKIRLDDPMVRYLPSHLYGGHRITIRHLLTHTSGLRTPPQNLLSVTNPFKRFIREYLAR
jgi:CubicO group peptidase (beta-lactamase class C family)